LADDLDRIFGTAVSRREALWYGAGGIVFLCSFDRATKRATRPTGTRSRLKRGGGSPFDPYQADLPIPPTLEPVLAPDADVYEIVMQQGTAEILPGYQTPVLGYQGLYPGPTIRANRGRTVRVTQTNSSDRELNVHLHGGLTEPQSDGHPDDFIPPGGQRIYTYGNEQRASTLWYHDHAHMQTAETLYAGLAAFYLLSDSKERSLDLPQDEFDVPLVIQDRSFNDDGSFRYVPNLDFGFYGDTILVNGAIAPRMAVKRRLYRLRLLNGSNARPYELRLGDNREMTQIAGDAGLLAAPVNVRKVRLQPAERAEVVVDFRGYKAGTELELHNALGEASTVPVMRFDVGKGGGAEEARVPKKLVRQGSPGPEPRLERWWNLDLGGNPAPRWEINGLGFDTDRVDARPILGSTEDWVWVNRSERLHPMHMHGVHFHVISQAGRRPAEVDRGWKDTVNVPPLERVKVRPYFHAHTGRYVFHCHAAEHGDNDMFTQLEIVEPA
jgi:spore coat protein A, manganese oxidase